MKTLILIGLTAVVMSLPGPAHAAIGFLTTTVTRTLVDSSFYGGCMAQIARSPSAVGLDCPTQWVTFSCTGDFSSKDLAYRKFDTAQLAMLQGFHVSLGVDDARKHNGHCFARVVHVIP